eukprot:scaffold34685_cov183-Amphora_coffeaeformis.AAC.11
MCCCKVVGWTKSSPPSHHEGGEDHHDHHFRSSSPRLGASLQSHRSTYRHGNIFEGYPNEPRNLH